MRILFYVLFLCLLKGYEFSVQAQIPVLEFNESYSSSDAVYITDLKFDNNGDMYLLASAVGTVQLGGVTFAAPTAPTPVQRNSYLILCKFRKKVLLWHKQSAGNLMDLPPIVNTSKIAIDSNNNVIISGAFCAENFTIDGQTLSMTITDRNQSGNNCYLMQFDTNGQLNWIRQFGGATKNSFINDIEIDGKGNVYALGTFENNIDFYGEETFTTHTTNAFLVKFDCSASPVYLKTYQHLPQGRELKFTSGMNIAIDKNNMPFFLISNNEMSNIVPEGDVLISAYPNGEVRYAKIFNDYIVQQNNIAQQLRMMDLDFDQEGNIILAGSFNGYDYYVPGQQLVISWNKIQLIGINGWVNRVALLMKLTNEGKGEWASQKIINAEPYSVVKVNSCGHIFTSGAALAEFTPEGNELWMIRDSTFFTNNNPFDIHQSSGTMVSKYKWLPKQQHDFTSAFEMLHLPMSSCPDTLIIRKTLDTLSFCTNDTFSYNFHGEAGYTYQWYRDNTPFAMPGILLKDSLEGIFRYTGINTNGCAVSDIAVRAIAEEKPSLALDKEVIKCPDQYTVLKPISVSPIVTSYQWYKAPNILTDQPQISVKEKGIYVLKVESLNGCSNQDSVQVINTLFEPSIEAAVLEKCKGDSIEISLDQLYQKVDLNWLYNGNPMEEQNEQIIIKNTGNYQLRLLDSLQCVWNSNTLSVIFQASPVVEIVETRLLSNCFETFTTGLLEVKGNFTTLLWSNGSQASSIEVNESGLYKVFATNTNGCEDSASYETTLKTTGLNKVPNLITPNDDGLNDTFEVQASGDYLSLEVYNSWGEKIYSNTDYHDTWGSNINDGVYYYSIFVSSSSCENTLHGWLHVVK